MNIENAVVAFVAIMMSASLAIAQPPQGPPPGGPGGPGGQQGGRHGGPPPHLEEGEEGEQGHRPPPRREEHSSESSGGGNFILAALDANQDFELSRTEIKNAVRVLRSLDTNGDGKITMEDNGGRGAQGGQGGHAREGRGPSDHGPGGRPDHDGPGHESGSDGEGEYANGFADRLIAFDKDGDGSIAKSELPSRMRRVVDNIDLNGDEIIDASELEQLRSASTPAANQGGRGGSGPGGGPGPEQMINHAFEFDQDGDGKLSRDELTAFAETMGQRGGPGGPPPQQR